MCATIAVAALACASAASAQPGAIMSVPPPGTASQTQLPILKEVGLDQKLNAQVPLETIKGT